MFNFITLSFQLPDALAQNHLAVVDVVLDERLRAHVQNKRIQTGHLRSEEYIRCELEVEKIANFQLPLQNLKKHLDAAEHPLDLGLVLGNLVVQKIQFFIQVLYSRIDLPEHGLLVFPRSPPEFREGLLEGA